jgi:hypothetical protein
MLPPEKRSPIFSMLEAGEEHRFDKVHVGLTLFDERELPKMLRRAKRGDRDIYFIQREGQSNKGHYFESFSELSHQERLHIIEYLKTL